MIRAGNIGEEIETIEILPQEAPLHVPDAWPTDAPAEPLAPAEPAPAIPVPEKTPVPV